jgi:hypothetical protein
MRQGALGLFLLGACSLLSLPAAAQYAGHKFIEVLSKALHRLGDEIRAGRGAQLLLLACDLGRE